MHIQLDEEMARIFQESTAVSSKYNKRFCIQVLSLYIASKGISANLLQAGSKRKRTKAQIEAEKEEALL